jgi:hypothetical protein
MTASRFRARFLESFIAEKASILHASDTDHVCTEGER